MSRRKFLGFGGSLALGACRRSAAGERSLSGTAFGTTWSVTWRGTEDQVRHETISRVLAEADRIFSTWRSDSEVCRLNQHPVGHPFRVSAELMEVLELAREVHQRSHGAFDPTVGPLVSAYGFGPFAAAHENPRPCFEALEWDRTRREVTKTREEVTLDFSGIAKGHAVDRALETLQAEGTNDLLVEIGGELRACGGGPGGAGWPVGVQVPRAAAGESGQIILLRDDAAATSGTYWQRRETPEGPVSHIIDPKTRRPVGHDTISVTVVADTAARADAWATALLVLGSAVGKEVAEREGMEAMFLKKPVSSDPGPEVTNKRLGPP